MSSKNIRVIVEFETMRKGNEQFHKEPTPCIIRLTVEDDSDIYLHAIDKSGKPTLTASLNHDQSQALIDGLNEAISLT